MYFKCLKTIILVVVMLRIRECQSSVKGINNCFLNLKKKMVTSLYSQLLPLRW